MCGKPPTSIMTIDSAYMSDLTVGHCLLRLSENTSRSSGAVQRIILLPQSADASPEMPFLVIEERPKSARRGLPLESMRMLDYG